MNVPCVVLSHESTLVHLPITPFTNACRKVVFLKVHILRDVLLAH